MRPTLLFTSTLVLLFVYAGDPDAGHAAIAPFREVATPYGEYVAPMPYAGIYEFSREAETPGPSTSRSVFMNTLDDASVDAIVDAFAVAPEGSMVQMRAFGGAKSRVPADATAFAHRTAAAQVTIINGFVDPDRHAEATAWNRALFAALEPKSSGDYVNFL